jgi:predicted ATPase
VVSEGTLRVLALCCLAGNPWPGELIAFEEPENGVHPRRIEVVANLLGSIAERAERAERRRSQVVVTTHSPTLIAAMLQRASAAPDLVKIFRCSQRGRATQVQQFFPTGPLFDDEEVRASLSGPEDTALVEAMLLRGWLDG